MSGQPRNSSSNDAKPDPDTAGPSKAAPLPIGPDGQDPAIYLPLILNFLRENDWNRDPKWIGHFKAIQEYVFAARNEMREGRPGYGSQSVLADLNEALMKIDLHQRIYSRAYEDTPWSTHVLPVKRFSDRLISYPKLHPRPNPGNDKSLLGQKRLDAPDPPFGPSPFYTPAPPAKGRSQSTVDDAFAHQYRRDQLEFWDTLDKHTWSKKTKPQIWEPLENNIYEVANQYYEYCIARGAGETNFRYDLGSEPHPPGPPALEPFIRDYARDRGLMRAAIQQGLNLFSNQENRSINTPWRRVVLPYEKVALPKEVPYQPRILAPSRVRRVGKEPFPWVYWYNKHKAYVDHVAFRKRSAYNTSHWADLDRTCVPINFRGPYIPTGRSVHDDYWMRAGKCLVDLEAHLKDRYAIYPRSLLKAMLNDIEAGKSYPYKQNSKETEDYLDDLRKRDYYKRRDIVLRDLADGDHGAADLPRYKLLDEWEMTWLRFVGETPRSFLMLEEFAELRQDNLALIFDNRMQEVLRAYGSWEKSEEKEFPVAGENIPIPIDELLKKINGAGGVMLDEDHLRQPNRAHQFTIEEAEHYVRVLARLGRCSFFAGNETSLSSVGPPEYDMFPEDRIMWRHHNAEELARSNISSEKAFLDHLLNAYGYKRSDGPHGDYQHYEGILDHRTTDHCQFLEKELARNEDEINRSNRSDFRPDDMLRTILRRYWVPEAHYIPGDPSPEKGIPQPSFDDLASWDDLWGWARTGQYAPTSEQTCQFLRALAFRMGVTIQYYNNMKTRMEETTPVHRDDIVRELDHWTSLVDQGEEYYTRDSDGALKSMILDTPSLKAVVHKADPEGLLESGFAYIKNKRVDSFVLLRKGLIDDCVQNRNMRYPGREAAFSDMSQTPFYGTQRPNLFTWATSAQRRYQAPYTRRTFFHMRRWPLHLQSTQRQEWYRNRVDEIPRIDPGLQETGILTARIEPSAIVPARLMSLPPVPQGPTPTGFTLDEELLDFAPGDRVDPFEEELQSLLKTSSWVPPRDKYAEWDPYDQTREKYTELEGRGYKDPKRRKREQERRSRSGPFDFRESTSTADIVEEPGPSGLIPFTRPTSEWIPGPAVFPMGETAVQEAMISEDLQSVIYPPENVTWGEWLNRKFYELTHKPPVRVPLLPNNIPFNTIPSAQNKRKLPVEFATQGPSKRPKPPVPDDGYPDSGKPLDPKQRVFQRAGRNTVRNVVVRKSRPDKLAEYFPQGWQRIFPTKTEPGRGARQTKGLKHAVEAITESLRTQYADEKLPEPGELERLFESVPEELPHWMEVRKHNGVEDDSYDGPYFGDRMAAALYLFGRRRSKDYSLALIDSRALRDPFVYPLPHGRNKHARILWVYYDGQLARLRPTPVARDYAWRLRDFDYWTPVRASGSKNVKNTGRPTPPASGSNAYNSEHVHSLNSRAERQ